MKKLLLTGASGFLGWNLCQVASKSYSVYGLCHKHSFQIPNGTVISCDLLDGAAVRKLFREIRPDAVIHCAACSNPNFCQQNPGESYKLNVTASSLIADLCADSEIPCAFTSTDLVFDGNSPPYDERSEVCPLNVYGQQKVTAELQMQARYDQVAICRMPLMYGDAPMHAASFIHPWIRQLRKGTKLSLFTDEFRTPVSGTDAAKGLLLALRKVRGIIHLGGKERISRFHFGEQLLEALSLDVSLISGCCQKDIPMAAPRPSDVSLASTTAFSLGYAPGSISDELQKLRCVVD